MRYNKEFFRRPKWAKYAIACLAALLIATGCSCSSNAPTDEPPQVPADASQAPADTTRSPEVQAPADTSPAPTDTPKAPDSQPSADATGQITSEDAKNAALTDAGISSSEATFTKEKLDYEDGIAVYELEFYTSTKEYEYEINAATGAVYSKSSETFHGSHAEHNSHSHNGTASEGSSSDIGAENARTLALEHAGLSADSVTYTKTELDMDDGLMVYEIEFYCDGKEYEYKLLASDGSVLEYEVD